MVTVALESSTVLYTTQMTRNVMHCEENDGRYLLTQTGKRFLTGYYSWMVCVAKYFHWFNKKPFKAVTASEIFVLLLFHHC